MRRSRFSEEQVISILLERETSSLKRVHAKHNISRTTYYVWKRKCGAREMSESRLIRAT